MKNSILLFFCFGILLPLLPAQNSNSTHYAIVYQGEKKGCVNENGKFIIPLEYDMIWGFEEGMVVVNKGASYDDNYNLVGGKWGFIDRNGNIVIPLEYEKAGDFSEGLAKVKKNGKFGFIDKQNRTVIPFKYEDVQSFSDGLSIVKIKDKWGAIDTKGQLVIPAVYDEINNFNEGVAAVFHLQKRVVDEEYGGSFDQGTYGLINKSNKLLLDTIYQYIGYMENGLARIRKGDLNGFINKTGKIVIPIAHYELSGFSEGLAAVGKYIDEEEEDYRYGYINTQGELVVDYKFTYAKDFENGLALVENGYYDYDTGGFNVIDKEGNFLFDEFHPNIDQYDDVLLVENNSGKHAIQYDGTKLTPSGYESLSYLGDGYFFGALANNGDKTLLFKDKFTNLKSYFFSMRAGVEELFIAEVITEKEYDLITKVGLINSKGQWILEPQFDSMGSFEPLDD